MAGAWSTRPTSVSALCSCSILTYLNTHEPTLLQYLINEPGWPRCSFNPPLAILHVMNGACDVTALSFSYAPTKGDICTNVPVDSVPVERAALVWLAGADGVTQQWLDAHWMPLCLVSQRLPTGLFSSLSSSAVAIFPCVLREREIRLSQSTALLLTGPKVLPRAHDHTYVHMLPPPLSSPPKKYKEEQWHKEKMLNKSAPAAAWRQVLALGRHA